MNVGKREMQPRTQLKSTRRRHPPEAAPAPGACGPEAAGPPGRRTGSGGGPGSVSGPATLLPAVLSPRPGRHCPHATPSQSALPRNPASRGSSPHPSSHPARSSPSRDACVNHRTVPTPAADPHWALQRLQAAQAQLQAHLRAGRRRPETSLAHPVAAAPDRPQAEPGLRAGDPPGSRPLRGSSSRC